MRLLLCSFLALGLAAADAPQPGRDAAFLTRILGDAAEGARPWKAYRMPEATASAVVEVVGELTPAELRQVAFQEFLAWFREDLARFWRFQGVTVAPRSLAAATLPVERFGGNPVPQNAPLLRVGF